MIDYAKIHAIAALKDNYIWALVHKDQPIALIVDPGDATPVKHFLKQHHLNLLAILITHHHADHTGGIAELKIDFPKASVFGPSQIKGVTHTVTNALSFTEFHLNFNIISIPGHTLEHIAYYSETMLFCGDTLFSAGCGRIFEGTAQQMYTALQKMAALPATTRVFCAHEYTMRNLHFAETVEPNNSHIKAHLNYVSEMRAQNKPSLPSTLQLEKNINPFLRCEVAEVINSAEKFAGKKLATPLDVFVALRQWKDQW